MTRLRVYVAGAYSADNVLEVFSNMRRGIKLAVAALKVGFSPYCPWLDLQYHLLEPFSLEDCYAYSMAWLEVSEAVLVVPVNYGTSKGAQAEVARAKELGIPVFYSLRDMQEWAEKERPITNSRLPLSGDDTLIRAGLAKGKEVA